MEEDQGPSIVHLVFGPPGTGKTRYLTTKVRQIVEKYGPDAVVVSSFTVTGAREIASRGLGLPDRAVGTLHSLAFRAIGHDHAVALDPDVLKDWNADVGQGWKITADTRRKAPQSATEGGAKNTDSTTASNGDELLAALDRARSTFVDPTDYEPELAVFAKAWEDWKAQAGTIDFTDMILLAWEAAKNGQAAPGNPMVLIVDEGQDMTPLETALVLAWGKHPSCASVVIACDDDQAIMEWRGSDPRLLIELGIDDGFIVDRVILDKSYRIPAAAHAVAEQWVKRLSIRQPKQYLPRTRTEPVFDAVGEPMFDEHGGQLSRDTGEIVTGAAWCVKENLESMSLVTRIEEEVARGKSVMVIASCAYMLIPLLKELRAVGMPFHNPYRPAEMTWNPLGRRSGVSTAARVLAYLMPHEGMGKIGRLWTGKDVRAWIDLIKIGPESGLPRGAKTDAANLPDGEVPWEQVAALFSDPDQLTRAVMPDLEWLAKNILPSKERATSYPLQVARKRGPLALMDQPMVIVGTIHSVKGGASDVVYLSPDLSPSGRAQLKDTNGMDQTIRQFYVGMTRCKEELRLLAPTARNSRQGLNVLRRNLIPEHLEVPA